MAKPVKLILVTADYHPYHRMWVKIAEEVSKETGLPLETRIEDYAFLVEHGDTDEYGMAWLPQLLAQLDDGSYTVLLSRLPLNEKLQADPEQAKRIILEKLSSLT